MKKTRSDKMSFPKIKVIFQQSAIEGGIFDIKKKLAIINKQATSTKKTDDSRTQEIFLTHYDRTCQISSKNYYDYIF